MILAITRCSFVTGEPRLQMSLHVGPFMREDAIHHAVARRSIAARQVMAEDAILLGPQRLNGSLRSEVEIVGAQPDYLTPQRVERVTEQQQLAGGVDVTALPALPIPGVTNLHAINLGDDVVIARGADDCAARQLPHSPGQHMPILLAGERVGDVCPRLLRFRNRSEPKFPEFAISRRDSQLILVFISQRLQTDAVVLKCNRVDIDHRSVVGRYVPNVQKCPSMSRAWYSRKPKSVSLGSLRISAPAIRARSKCASRSGTYTQRACVAIPSD